MALDFNGTTQYLNATSVDRNIYPMTMFCCWYAPNTSQDLGFTFHLADATTNWHRVTCVNPYLGNAYYQAKGTAVGHSNIIISYGTGWNYSTFVLTSATDRKAYLNGTSATSTQDVGNLTAVDNTMIGARYDITPAISGYYKDKVADCAIWNVALTDAEVTLLESGFSPLFIRKGNLVFYKNLINSIHTPAIGVSLTENSGPITRADHPQTLYPTRGFSAYFSPAGGPTGNDTKNLTVGGTSHTDIVDTVATLKITPDTGFLGETTFKMTSTDDTARTDIDTITVNVIDPPVNTMPGTQLVRVGEETAIAGISTTSESVYTITAKVTVSNGTTRVILTDPNPLGYSVEVSAGTNGSADWTIQGLSRDVGLALGSLLYTPTSTFAGNDTLTLLTTDGLAQTDSDNITITVQGAPINTHPGTFTIPSDTRTNLSGISVSDPDNDINTIRLSVTRGALVLTGTPDATIVSGASGIGIITISGTTAQLNQTLAMLAYTPETGTSGNETFTMTTTDDSNLVTTSTATLQVNLPTASPTESFLYITTRRV